GEDAILARLDTTRPSVQASREKLRCLRPLFRSLANQPLIAQRRYATVRRQELLPEHAEGLFPGVPQRAEAEVLRHEEMILAVRQGPDHPVVGDLGVTQAMGVELPAVMVRVENQDRFLLAYAPAQGVQKGEVAGRHHGLVREVAEELPDPPGG